MSDEPTTQNRNLSSTFAKGLRVLEAFDGNTPNLTLADISRATGQDRAAARRGALTLVDLGYLVQNDRQFSLTPKVLSLAGGFLKAHGFGRLVQPVLNNHASALGAEITLATRDGPNVLLLAQSTVTDRVVSQGFTAGSRLPLLHTSLGRMLLAGEPPATAADLIGSLPIPRPTDQALTNADEILSRIATARGDGYVMTDSEFEPGIIGLAVSVNGRDQTPVVLGTSLPKGRNSTPPVDPLLLGLQRCAAELRQTSALDRL